jgi:hypothetical protein
MPYYVFRINESAGALVKNLELIETFEKFRDAKLFAKEQRASAEVGDMSMIKVMFADNQLSAEEQLMEKREKPVVMEWEK